MVFLRISASAEAPQTALVVLLTEIPLQPLLCATQSTRRPMSLSQAASASLVSMELRCATAQELLGQLKHTTLTWFFPDATA